MRTRSTGLVTATDRFRASRALRLPGACALVLMGCGTDVAEHDAALRDVNTPDVTHPVDDAGTMTATDAQAPAVDAGADVPVVAQDGGMTGVDGGPSPLPLGVTLADVTLHPGMKLERTVAIASVPAGATFTLQSTVASAAITGTVAPRTGIAGSYVLTLTADAVAPLGTSTLLLRMTAGATVRESTFGAQMTAAPTLDDLRSMMIGSTSSTHTPLGVHFETAAAHTFTAAQLAPLGAAATLPAIPPSTSGLHNRSFHVTLYPHGRPDPVDVTQHAIGDCDGDAALAAMAYSAPSFVQSLIHDNGDATYDVSMFDPRGNPVTVRVNSVFLAYSDNTLAAASGENGVADWATVLEKAVMKYLDVYHIIPDIGGIGSEFLTPMFTGTGASYAFDRGVLSPAQLQHAIRVALETGHFVTGGFNPVKSLGQQETVVAHAYTVMVPTDATTMITMRNPWGMSPLRSGGYDTSHDGVLDLPSTTDWSDTIDIRIIEPGRAGEWIETTPFHYTATGAGVGPDAPTVIEHPPVR